jgi:hypothetical protein
VNNSFVIIVAKMGWIGLYNHHALLLPKPNAGAYWFIDFMSVSGMRYGITYGANAAQ